MRTRIALALSALVASALFSGCATTRHIDLRYPPASDKEAVESSAPRAAAPRVHLAEFVDRRARPAIGELRGAYGERTGDVETASGIRQAVAAELERAGFRVESGEALQGAVRSRARS